MAVALTHLLHGLKEVPRRLSSSLCLAALQSCDRRHQAVEDMLVTTSVVEHECAEACAHLAASQESVQALCEPLATAARPLGFDLLDEG